jgi:protein SCO1/2
MSALARCLVLSTLVAATALTGCQGQSDPAAKEAAKLYDVKGTVTALDRGKKTVTLDHEDIPGLMKAMKMDFAVEEATLLDSVAVGDAVTGKLKADGGKYVVTTLAKR